MPICINCTHPTPTLYTTTTSKAGSTIRLTQCTQCKKFADKYVEHDYVVLFIDLVLVKREVLRHLLFNRGLNGVDSTSGVAGGGAAATTTATASTAATAGAVRRPRRYGLDESIWRLGVLLVLFDVYITWARIEQTGSNATRLEERVGTGRTGSSGAWLPTQYLFFLTVNVLATLAQHCTVRGLAHLLLRQKSGRSQQPVYPSSTSTDFSTADKATTTTSGSAISTALLVSSCIKLFPILLVIWPTTGEDDTEKPSSSSGNKKSPFASRASSYITYFVLFNNIEALQVLLDLGYVLSTALALSGIVARGVVESWLFSQAGLEGEGTGLVADMIHLLTWARSSLW